MARRSVTLLDERREDTSTLWLVAHHTGGALRIEGQDLGPITRPVSPDGEYEYFYTVMAEHIPALVVALGGKPGDDILTVLEQRWSGRRSYRLSAAIQESGVPYEFYSYP